MVELIVKEKLIRHSVDSFHELIILGLTLDVVAVYSELGVDGEKYSYLRFEGAVAHRHTLGFLADNSHSCLIGEADAVVEVSNSKWLQEIFDSNGIAKIPWRDNLKHYSVYLVGCGVINVIAEAVDQSCSVEAQTMKEAILKVFEAVE